MLNAVQNHLQPSIYIEAFGTDIEAVSVEAPDIRLSQLQQHGVNARCSFYLYCMEGNSNCIEDKFRP